MLQVVGSRCWPLISRYRASVRTQSPKVEMIDSLFKPLDDGKDDGIIRCCKLIFSCIISVYTWNSCSCTVIAFLSQLHIFSLNLHFQGTSTRLLPDQSTKKTDADNHFQVSIIIDTYRRYSIKFYRYFGTYTLIVMLML